MTLGNSNGKDTLTAGYTYESFVKVYEILPNFGPTSGGTQVTVYGSGFTLGAQLRIGALPAANMVLIDEETITGTTGRGAAAGSETAGDNPCGFNDDNDYGAGLGMHGMFIDGVEFEAEGVGLGGNEAVLEVEIYVDGKLYETSLMPTAFSKRKHEVSWKYNMADGPHSVKVVLKDPVKGYGLNMSSVLIYGPEPAI